MRLIVTSLVKSTHSLRYIDKGTKIPILSGSKLEIICSQTIEFEYIVHNGRKYNIEFNIINY